MLWVLSPLDPVLPEFYLFLERLELGGQLGLALLEKGLSRPLSDADTSRSAAGNHIVVHRRRTYL